MSYKVDGRGYFIKVNDRAVRAEPANMPHTTWIPGGPHGVVFHYTVGCSDDIKGTLETNGFGGPHFCVGKDGTIRQYAPLTVATWHCFDESHHFYGIEHTAYPGHGCELNDAQLAASAALSAALVEWMDDRYENEVPLRHLTTNLSSGFHDHYDFRDDGQNSHTDHLYHWSWGHYLAAVAAEGDQMTDEQRKQLKAATAALNGVQDFLAGKEPPEDAGVHHKQMYRALMRAASTPAPVPGGPHTHTVTGTAK